MTDAPATPPALDEALLARVEDGARYWLDGVAGRRLLADIRALATYARVAQTALADRDATIAGLREALEQIKHDCDPTKAPIIHGMAASALKTFAAKPAAEGE